MKLTKTRHRETVEVASRTSAITSEVHYGFVYIDEPIFGRSDNNDNGDFADSEEQFYYTTNNLYNVVALLDTSGNIIETYKYTPYGEVTVYVDDGGDGDWTDGDETVGTLSGNYYTFTGRRSDPESELMYFRNRYYSPELGRFVTRDPIVEMNRIGWQPQPDVSPRWLKQEITWESNLYVYVEDNPLCHLDPLGLQLAGLECILLKRDFLKRCKADCWIASFVCKTACLALLPNYKAVAACRGGCWVAVAPCYKLCRKGAEKVYKDCLEKCSKRKK